jgi:hypothetical protein
MDSLSRRKEHTKDCITNQFYNNKNLAISMYYC